MASLKIQKFIYSLTPAASGINVRLKHDTIKALTIQPMGKHWSTVKARNKVIRRKTEVENLEFDDKSKSIEELEEKETPKFGEIYEEVSRKLRRNEAAMKFNMSRKKYFKQPPELCLLTWAAREQLRYLHHVDPEQWTIRELAKSFPISEEGVKKLLKSNFTLKNEEEVARWDENIRKRWKGMKMGGGPIKVKLPEKDMKERALVSVEEALTTPKNRYFSSILDKYLPDARSSERKDAVMVTNEVRDEHMEIDGLANSRKNKYARQLTADQFLRQNKIAVANNESVSDLSADSSKGANVEHEQVENNLKRNNSVAMENDFESENFQGRVKYEDQTEINLKWSERHNRHEKEAYLYDEKLGYQRPLGITDDTLEKIRVNPNDVKNGLIRVGDKYYNEEGEFLYRVPGITK